MSYRQSFYTIEKSIRFEESTNRLLMKFLGNGQASRIAPHSSPKGWQANRESRTGKGRKPHRRSTPEYRLFRASMYYSEAQSRKSPRPDTRKADDYIVKRLDLNELLVPHRIRRNVGS